MGQRAGVKDELTHLFTEMYGRELDMDVSFADQGIDSLDGIELLLEVEKKLGVYIDDDIAAKIKTPQDLLELLQEATSPKLT